MGTVHMIFVKIVSRLLDEVACNLRWPVPPAPQCCVARWVKPSICVFTIEEKILIKKRLTLLDQHGNKRQQPLAWRNGVILGVAVINLKVGRNMQRGMLASDCLVQFSGAWLVLFLMRCAYGGVPQLLTVRLN